MCWRHVAVECGTDGTKRCSRSSRTTRGAAGGGAGTRRHYDKWRCDGQMWTNDVDSRTRAEGAGERMERTVGGMGRGRAASGRGVSRRVVAGEIAGGGGAPSRSASCGVAPRVNFRTNLALPKLLLYPKSHPDDRDPNAPAKAHF